VWLPLDNRLALTFVAVLIALGLTGWLAAWLTRLPVFRLVGRKPPTDRAGSPFMPGHMVIWS
jgi:hypothetical protein